MGKFYFYILGIITGLANGLFGSGGGIIPLSIVSSIFYYNIIKDIFTNTLIVIAVGLAGSLLGGFFMKKIPSKYLKKAFGVILIISGVRLLCK